MSFNLTFDNFMNTYYLSLRRAEEEGQRPGQWFFNCLWDERPDIAEIIRGSLHVDPFFDDAKLYAAIKAVEELWDEVTVNPTTKEN